MKKHYNVFMGTAVVSVAESTFKTSLRRLFLLALSLTTVSGFTQTTIGGVNMGNLTDYLFFFADGSKDANWQGATKGFVGDVAVDGIKAKERTSGGVPFAGTIFTNDNSLGAWSKIVDQNDPGQVNPAQAFGVTNQTARIASLKTTSPLRFRKSMPCRLLPVIPVFHPLRSTDSIPRMALRKPLSLTLPPA